MITYRDLDLIEVETDILLEEIMEELEEEMMGERAYMEADDGTDEGQTLLQGEEGRQLLELIGGELDTGAEIGEVEPGD